MPDISKITLPNGNTYDIKDEVARSAAGAGLQIEVVTTREDLPTASSSTMGKIYLVAHDPDGTDNYYDEYVTVRTGSSTYTYSWEMFGTTEVDLSNYSVKTHTHSVTSNVTVDSHSYTPAGTISQPTFSSGRVSASGSITPLGSIAVAETSEDGYNVLTDGAVYISSTSGPGHTVPITASGTNSSSSVTFGTHTTATVPTTAALGTTTVPNVTAVGTLGTAASCTFPVLACRVSGETLTIDWTDGSFTANTPTTLPTLGTAKTVATYDSTKTASPITALGAATAAAQTFTGNSVYPYFIGTKTKIKFVGESTSVSVTGNATGTVSQPTFTGTAATITHTVTNGTVTSGQASA